MTEQTVLMNELLSKLTGEQALAVLEKLAAADGEAAVRIEAEARRVLAAVDVDEVSEEVFAALDMIDVQDCWDRAGRSRDGYTSPDEAAVELIEGELQPSVDQLERYRELGMMSQERDFCMGVILGLYRYERESKSAFKDWCVDIPLDSAGWILSEWRERNTDTTARDAMSAFLCERCPEWAKYLTRE